MGALISAADPQTHQAKILYWWIKDAIREHFDPVTEDQIDEALIMLADAGAMSLFDDPQGVTWFRLAPHLWPTCAPQTGEPDPGVHSPLPPLSSRQNVPQRPGSRRPRFEPVDDPDCTRGARSLREGESAGARGRGGVSGAAQPPSPFCEIHQPNGAGFDEHRNPIDCRVCGDQRMVYDSWMIINGYRKPSRR